MRRNAIAVLCLCSIHAALLYAAEPPATGGKQVLLKEVGAVNDTVWAEVKDFTQARPGLVTRLVFMRAAGVKDMDYPTLVMLDGCGTSFAYHPKLFQPPYQPPDPPWETEARLARGAGFGMEWLPKVKNADEGWEVVKASIDAGTPLQANWYDDFIILGYHDAAEKADRKVYFLGDWDAPGWRTWAKFEEWCQKFGRMARQTKMVEKAPTKETALAVLQAAVRYAEHDGRAEVRWMGHAQFGLAGMEAYAADTADVTKTPDYFDGGWLGCHCVYRQITGRKCAAIYFRRVAAEFPKPVSDHILAAATEYEAAWAAWQEWEKHLGKVQGRTKAEELKKVWAVEANRKAGASAMRAAIEREKAAVAAIAQALRVMPK